MIAVWILGPLLAWLTGAYLDTWLQIKFVLVIIMSGMHGFLVRCWRDFAADRNTRSARFYRIVNEVPAVLMVLIVILVRFSLLRLDRLRPSHEPLETLTCAPCAPREGIFASPAKSGYNPICLIDPRSPAIRSVLQTRAASVRRRKADGRCKGQNQPLR